MLLRMPLLRQNATRHPAADIASVSLRADSFIDTLMPYATALMLISAATLPIRCRYR